MPEKITLKDPFRRISLEDFLSSLDGDNSGVDSVKATLSMLEEDDLLRIFRKPRDLISVIEHIKSIGLYPFVDNGTQTVFAIGSGGHELLAADLYEYHTIRRAGADYDYPYDAAAKYISENMGYYITSMGGIVSGATYRGTKADGDVFMTYGTAKPGYF